MRSSNPVLGRLTERAERHSGLRREPAPYGSGGYGSPYGVDAEESYAPHAQPVAPSEAMTVDDVVVRTATTLTLVALSAAVSWMFVPIGSGLGNVILLGGGLGALAMALFISFKQVTNPLAIGAYAILQGLVVGAFSKIYANAFGGGIVLQAVVCTFAIFLGMALIYKARIIRATPRFTRWMMGAMIGALALIMVNFGLAIFGVNNGDGLGLRSGGTFSIVVSLVFIAIASLSFILDFDAVEQGVAQGLPSKYAWYCAFGIVVGLVWLYFEILRLLGYMRD